MPACNRIAEPVGNHVREGANPVDAALGLDSGRGVVTERGPMAYVRCFFFSAAGNSTLLRISR
jgi:hypothetical protein